MTCQFGQYTGMAEKHKRVAEDVVEYSLFPGISGDKQGNELKNLLQEHVRSHLTHLSPWLIDVIWQNEGFNLRPVDEQGSTPAHIAGQTNFGDNVEDEWFIVYLLFQLTKQFPGLVAKVCDSDEEFMLIEAADVLPKWLNPETAENRVYIYKGNLHIIPIPQSPGEVALFPKCISSIGDAVECIRTYPDQTKAAHKINDAVQKRIKNFPDLIQESVHHTHCYIPASMAAILEESPELIAAAVRAFYYRDPIDLQCCRTFNYFRPGTRVMTKTRFTRCLYAQLVHQQFTADKRSGWVMPASSNPKYRSHDLGMKLAHGFEILCHKSSDSPVSVANGHAIPTNDVRWLQYVKALKEKKYFRGELEGSILYQELLESAWKFYQENLTQNKRTNDAGVEILQLLKTVQYNVEERRRAESLLEPPDDDSWMNLTPESLDAMMKARSGNHGDQDDDEAVFDLSQVANSMKQFVGKVSDVDGAEFPGVVDDEDADIQFDGSGFISAMQEMFEFNDSETDSSSDMSEYGWEEDSDGETKPKTKAKIKRPPSLDKYMDIMDRELAKTDVGKSFEKQATKPKRSSQKNSPGKKKSAAPRDINEEDDDFQPVDIDMNTVKNLLESYGAQEGLAGPTSNILGSMGIAIPPNTDNEGGAKPTKTPPPRPPMPASKTKATPNNRPVPAPRRSSSTNSVPGPVPISRSRLKSKETDV